MILSNYNLCVNNGTHALIFNTKSGAIVVTTLRKWNEIVNLIISDEERKLFLDLGIIVQGEDNEFQYIQNKCIEKIHNSNLKKYRILTTTGCNAKCWYCYEKGISHSTMNENTAMNVAKFIVDNISKQERVYIEWFGGEPLLNIAAIDIISKYLKEHLPNFAMFQSSIISNASCINDAIIAKMKNDWQLKRIQITIDGIGSKYEKVKQLGIGSFERLILNIDKLVEAGIKVDIRLNFNEHNIDSIQDVVSFFRTYKYKDRISIYTAKIFSEKSKYSYFDLEQETIAIDEIMHKAQFKMGLDMIPRVFKTSCMATYPGFFTIDPLGRLFKCDRRLLNKNSLATVEDWKGKTQELSIWQNLDVAEKCKKCALYPLCWGGCVYDRLNKIYPCYLSINIVKHCLQIALEDILPNCSKEINVFLRESTTLFGKGKEINN